MKLVLKVFLPAILVLILCSTYMAEAVPNLQQETMMGAVVKKGKDLVLEADDGDYLIRGADVSHLLDRLVIVTGIIKASPRGDVVEITTIEDLADTED